MEDLKLLFIQSIKQNNIDLVKKIIENKKIDPQLNEGFAFRFACENGFEDLFLYIANLEEFINYKINYKTFSNVIHTNDYKIIKFLINHKHLQNDCYTYKSVELSWELFNDLEVTFSLFDLPIINKDLKENNNELFQKINKKHLKHKFVKF